MDNTNTRGHCLSYAIKGIWNAANLLLNYPIHCHVIATHDIIFLLFIEKVQTGSDSKFCV